MISIEFMTAFGVFIFVLVAATSMFAGNFDFSGPKGAVVIIIIFIYAMLFYFVNESEKKVVSFNEGNNIYCSDNGVNEVVSIGNGWTISGSNFVKDEKFYSVMKCNRSLKW